ncbi:PREDICTED: cyclic AMP-dependent transcription factor ATF-2 [Polistes dominula]|uniref:Cyclic AMP-dependent transcription factor ATF-2 n=1 Tax=Polistes dominula TaxID=743375 RepID=A0ABM1J4P7_POLDO|nr:PREDICTED: cyclic AMP-dependent transcription factor ATF-2 [Polistes dominula]
MSDVEKHFICTSPGCNMSFTDEDHLAIHRKKHDMVLNLENNDKNSGFVVDQTPTPTRFIRNCEEVGLFQDLQNVNPFEETFRRAVEARNTGTLTVPGEVETTDDTLHTPHIFPHIADVLSDGTHILSETNQECSTPITVIGEKPTTSKDKSTVSTQTYSDLNLHLNESHFIKENTLASSKTTALHAESIVLQHLNVSVTPKRVMQQSSSKLSINGEEVELLLKTADGKLMQLSANPIYESSSQSSNNASPSSHVSTIEHTKQQNVLMRSELPRINIPISESKKALPSKMTFAKMKLQQILTKKVNTKTDKSPETITTVRDDNISQRQSKEENSKQSIDQHRKKDLLERNRASSMRAREKRKAWVQHLQKTMTKVNETNSILELEVKALRNELTRLKTLLLAHKDCPVTKEMQKGNGVVLGTKIISVNNDSIDTTASSTNNLTIKTLPTIVPDLTNKKSLSTSCIKNPIILPKIIEQRPVTMTTPTIISNGTIVKSIPGIELIEVTHFMAEKDNDVVKQPQIMIVQNPTMRLDEGSPKRKIIRLNPNYEIRQVWSKSTTT